MVAEEGSGAAEGAAAEDGGAAEGDAGEATAAEGEAARRGGDSAGEAVAEGDATPVVLPSASSAAGSALDSSSSQVLHGATTGSSSAAASSAWPHGMDPNSSYLLKIRLLGNPKNARKDICFYFEKDIDSDLINFKDLVESIVEEYPPRYLEVAHIQYYDDVLKTFPEVKSDQELMSMFEKHTATKFVHLFVSYCDPSEPYEPISEYDMHVEPNTSAEQDEESYLRNPIPENEHVGIDEENVYFGKEPISLNMVLFSDKAKDRDYVPEDESEDESEDEDEVEEEEEVHEADYAQNAQYDKADPPMTVGSTYPSMDEFKAALRQHAVKREFEYNTEKSTPQRFRCYCKRRDEDDCPWRIHASTTDDLQQMLITCLIPDVENHQRRGQGPAKRINHQLCHVMTKHLHGCVFHQAWRIQQRKRIQVTKRENVSTLNLEDQRGQELAQSNSSQVLCPRSKQMVP